MEIWRTVVLSSLCKWCWEFNSSCDSFSFISSGGDMTASTLTTFSFIFSARNLNISVWPWRAAQKIGVSPNSLRAVSNFWSLYSQIFNTFSARFFIESLQANSWSIVLPSLFFIFQSGGCICSDNIPNNSFTRSFCLKRMAIWRNVLLQLLLKLCNGFSGGWSPQTRATYFFFFFKAWYSSAMRSFRLVSSMKAVFGEWEQSRRL